MLGTNVEANTNITLNEFKSLVKADGYNMDNVTFPSYFNQLLNNNPIIFYNQDRTKIMCFTGVVKANGRRDYYPNITIGIVNKQYVIGYQLSNVTTYKELAGSYGFDGYNISSDLSNRIGCSIDLNTYTFTDIRSGFNGYNYYYGRVYPYIGYSYSYHQNDCTIEEFYSLSFIKKKLLENVIFYGKSLHYNNNDIFYKFNGVYVGDNNTFIPGATCISYNDTYFEYMSNSTYNDVFFEIQDCPLSEITSWKSTDYETLDFSSYFTTRLNIGNYGSNVKHDIASQKISYEYLLKFMEFKHIYRLVVTTRVNNSSGDTLNTYYCTSCFFSLNDWKSNSIVVKNISKSILPDDSDLVIDIPGSDDDSNNDQIKLSDILSFNSGDVLSEINGIKDIKFDFANTVLDYQTKFFNGGGSGDLEIAWNGISLFGAPLIKSGTFNISKLVREDAQLTRLHHIIQVFSISSFGIYLISAYWNLFLATLGLGSYFYMNSDTEIEALEDNTVISEMDSAMDEYRISQAKSKRDNYYSNLVAKSRANLLRKAGRKDE